MGVLTPGSPTRPTIQSHPPSSASDNFHELFPSSPLSIRQSETIPVQLSPSKPIVNVEESLRSPSSAGNPSEEGMSSLTILLIQIHPILTRENMLMIRRMRKTNQMRNP